MTGESDLARARESTYQALKRVTGEDDLHQLITRDGLEILDYDIPYLVRRLRWLSADRARRARREIPSEPRHLPVRSIDPAAIAGEWVEIADALAALEESDAALLWWAAAGYSTAEQQDLWNLAEYEPAAISTSALRQRLSRARRQLREQLGVL